jgi:predicted dehydrogenase
MSREETPLRVGLIGLGAVAEAHLAGAADAAGRGSSGADLDPRAAGGGCRPLGITTYAEAGAMRRPRRLDIACVLTPALTHRAMTLEAAAPRRPRRCARSRSRRRLTTPARSSPTVPPTASASPTARPTVSPRRTARQLVAEGASASACLLAEGSSAARTRAWRDLAHTTTRRAGRAAAAWGLVDHGIHLVDVFRWLTGSEVAAVVGRGNLSGGPPATEFLTMLFECGAVGQLVYNEATFGCELPPEGTFSWGGRWAPDGRVLPGGGWDAHPLSIRVHGSRGALRVMPYAHKLYLFEAGAASQVPLDGTPMPGNFTRQLESFALRIRRGEQPEVTGADGVRALEVVFAAYRSIGERRFVVPGEGC